MLSEQEDERGEVRESFPRKGVEWEGGNDASGGGGSCRTVAQQHPVCPSLHRNEAELVGRAQKGTLWQLG